MAASRPGSDLGQASGSSCSAVLFVYLQGTPEVLVSDGAVSPRREGSDPTVQLTDNRAWCAGSVHVRGGEDMMHSVHGVHGALLTSGMRSFEKRGPESLRQEAMS